MALTFGIDTAAGDTPESVARRRQTADLLAARIFGNAPKNLGEGIGSLGQSLIAGMMARQANDAQAAGMATVPPEFGGTASAGIASAIAGQPVPSTPSAPMGATSIPAGSQEFTNTVMPLAEGASEKTGLDPRLIAAQAALESGYGKSAPGNNLFGIKSHGQPGGNMLPTSEVVNGQPVQTSDSFRAYASPADSVNGYADFINQNPRYKPTMAAPTLEGQAAALGQSGYATDPNYGQKVLSIAQRLPAPNGGILADNSASPLDAAQYPAGPVGAPTSPAGAAPVALTDGGAAAIPTNAQPAQGALPAASQPSGPFAKYSDADLMRLASNPWVKATSPGASAMLTAEMQRRATVAQQAADPLRKLQIQEAQTKLAPIGAPYKDADGNLVQRDALGKVSVLSAADKTPNSVREFEYGQNHPDFVQQQLLKTKAGAAQVVTNVDTGAAPAYDKVLTEGLAKSHAALSNGVEDAQTRARDIAAMQGAIDQIQRNGGTTGGMGQQQILDLKKTINAGAAGIGITTPFSENDISDKEFLTKFNRSMAGAQAKSAVGSRVTNFEMSNFLKANPGLDMSITGNQRLLGIQAQIEQRNIAVGNAIRNATADAVSTGKKINPKEVQGIISGYDDAHHITDPVSGQDLTQSYVLPDFQKPGMGTNSSLAVGHEKNINGIKIKRLN